MRIKMPSLFRSRRWLPILLLSSLAGPIGCSKESTPQPPTFTTSLPSENELRDRLDAVIDHSLHNRTLNTRDHNAWQIVHGILPYGKAFKIERVDGDKKELIPALDWLLSGGALNGWDLRPGAKGVFAVLAPGSKAAQGHPDQWIGYLSQGGEDGLSGLSPDEKITVQGRQYTIGDLMTEAEWDIDPGMEACWTLMALSAYRPSNYEWTAKDGEKWTVERVAEMEAGAPVVGEGASCGGTHRLYGLTVAVNRCMKDTGTPMDKLTGGWKKAGDVVQDCVRKAREYQQPDGSFSTQFFARPSKSPEVDTTLHATGHTLEWLCVALDDKQLQEPWVTAAVTRLCQLLEDNQNRELDCGALYHAARGLRLYRERRFGANGDSPKIAKADSHGPTKQETSVARAPQAGDDAPAPPPTLGK
jgi:hypothetical protein